MQVDTNKIELVSPNGKNKLVLLAGDDYSGLWFSSDDDGGGKKEGVHIWINHKKHDAGVGVAGKTGLVHAKGYNACLSADSNGDGHLQLIDKDGNNVHISE